MKTTGALRDSYASGANSETLKLLNYKTLKLLNLEDMQPEASSFAKKKKRRFASFKKFQKKLMRNLIKQDSIQEEWYIELVEDCRAIITEAVFTSRWALVEGYWNLGKRIREELKLRKWEQNKAGRVLQGLAKDLKISERTLYYSLQLYDKYPQLDKIPEGKNITWNKLITKYLPEPEKKQIPLPKGKYNVIYIDPPWPYNERQDPKNLYGNTKYHYPSMSIEEIKKLPVRELKMDNSVLFIWVATHFLEKSFEVIKAWGFNYKSQMIWVKKGGQGGIGWYCWGDHEILLIATSGSFLPKKLFSSVYQSPRQKHSEKPAYYYKMIEEMYPGCKYIELFARNKEVRKGWTYWGNESKNK